MIRSRFVTDFLRVCVDQSQRRRGGAEQSMRLISPTYTCGWSVTNLISDLFSRGPVCRILYTYCMISRGTVKLLSPGMGRRPAKLLPKSVGRRQQFHRSSPLPRDNNLTVSQEAMRYVFYYLPFYIILFLI
jgi:hypothetical protein